MQCIAKNAEKNYNQTVACVMVTDFTKGIYICHFSQWLIAQLEERSLYVMKDPGLNLGADICSFRY
jgi:hypothetical protein